MTQQQKGGYDITLVSEENIYQYECCICQLILRDVQQVVPCGHRFCQNCLKKHQEVSQHSLCPSCMGEITSTFPDGAWKRQIMNLKVKCQNHNKSCDWTGEIKDLQVHQDNTCCYEEVSCQNGGCKERMQRRILKEHQQTNCLFRDVQCSYCKKEILFISLEKHHKLCGLFPLECSNKCGRTDVKREEMDKHIQNDCPVTIHECKYKNVGCEVKGNLSSLDKHVNENMEQHLHQAVQKQEIVQNTLGFMQKKLDQTEKKLDQTEKKLDQTEKKLDQTEKKLGQSRKILDHVLNTLENAQKNFIEYKENINLTLRRMQNKLNDCPFTFVLTDFQKKFEDAKINNSKIISDDFFCLNGYHAEIWIHLNGGVTYRNTHVSAYIYLIKGPFDDELKWPMKAKFKFLVKGDNCDDKINITNTSSITKEKRQDVLSNPSVVTERRSGWGFLNYIPHEDLHKYVKDDSITFRIDVTGL